MPNVDALSFSTDLPIDKIVSDFDGNTTTHTMGAATLGGGGYYLPKTDTLTIANPYGEKCYFTMMWSIDGVNYYPNKYKTPNPSASTPTGIIGACAGMTVSDSTITFYFTHYQGTSVTFTLFWTLDTIL